MHSLSMLHGSTAGLGCGAARRHCNVQCAAGRQTQAPRAMWTRPTPGRDEDFVKPSYIPRPSTQPIIQPNRREDQPLYSPAGPEFRPAERPEQPAELPEQPKMPERRPDPIPAGNPKKKEAPPKREGEREAPPPKESEPQSQ
ncbi:hypothetical protein DUNSADRAFT_3931 [Dunaliella salina]|uniref:Encoded protein n=1 Tax=Dunaliella salina TaxID=3046 RepID=A0ABQ7H7R9_DUNSA|nr:hypothetical protein DUNSADRAFT_3931 [Dunaliella salina]|eukprot:KAF5842904.1 hypothetical protein DUNSADRAFT_3931 [Dunaliella salina]